MHDVLCAVVIVAPGFSPEFSALKGGATMANLCDAPHWGALEELLEGRGFTPPPNIEKKLWLDQLGIQTDLCRCQHLGNRAAFLGVLSKLGKGRGVDLGNLRFRVQFNAGDAETLTHFLQMYRGRGVNAGGGKASLAQSGGKRHGKAPGVSRGNQFLGIGSHSALKPGGK